MRAPSFPFFLNSSGIRLVIHNITGSKGFCFGVQQGLLITTTSANDVFLSPSPSPLDNI